MINEISINSNNAIEMSRGDLLTWLNDLLNTNLTKIEQLGTGSIYCQLLQELYPAHKIPISKVNFKAKNQYQYLNNFKVLQQSFTKFGITRHIDVEKLIKCKYQDNLEFLQWFKKIFDNSGHHEDANALLGVKSLKEKENRMTFSRQTSSSNGGTVNNDKVQNIYVNEQDKSEKLSSKQRQSLPSQRKVAPKNTTSKGSNSIQNINNSEQIQSQKIYKKISDKKIAQQVQPYYSPSKGLPSTLTILNTLPADNLYPIEEREFMMKKFKQIEHLLEFWDYEKTSKQLADNMRKIILCPPDMNDFQIDQSTGEVLIKQSNYKQAKFELKQFNQQEQCPEIQKENEITKTVSDILETKQVSNVQNEPLKRANQQQNCDSDQLTQQQLQRENQESENNQTIITHQNIKTQLFVESKISSPNIQN